MAAIAAVHGTQTRLGLTVLYAAWLLCCFLLCPKLRLACRWVPHACLLCPGQELLKAARHCLQIVAPLLWCHGYQAPCMGRHPK